MTRVLFGPAARASLRRMRPLALLLASGAGLCTLLLTGQRLAGGWSAATASPPPALRARFDRLLRQIRPADGLPPPRFVRIPLSLARGAAERPVWVCDWQPPGRASVSLMLDEADGRVRAFSRETWDAGPPDAEALHSIRTESQARIAARFWLAWLGRGSDAVGATLSVTAPEFTGGRLRGVWRVRVVRPDRPSTLLIDAVTGLLIDFREVPHRVQYVVTPGDNLPPRPRPPMGGVPASPRDPPSLPGR
jgi:hypothetical protein